MISFYRITYLNHFKILSNNQLISLAFKTITIKKTKLFLQLLIKTKNILIINLKSKVKLITNLNALMQAVTDKRIYKPN